MCFPAALTVMCEEFGASDDKPVWAVAHESMLSAIFWSMQAWNESGPGDCFDDLPSTLFIPTFFVWWYHTSCYLQMCVFSSFPPFWLLRCSWGRWVILLQYGCGVGDIFAVVLS
jgi:hypothetical protein